MSLSITVEPEVVEVTVDLSNTGLTVSTSPIEVAVNAESVDLTVEPNTMELTVSNTLVGIVVNSATVAILTAAEQGPAGIDGASAGAAFDSTNKSGATINAGSPCASHSSGVGVVLAVAMDDTIPAVGLAINSPANLATTQVQTSGPFTLADWTAITGSASLVAKGRYYLSTVAGQLMTTPPATTSNIVQLVGVAVSDDTLDIQIWDYIVL